MISWRRKQPRPERWFWQPVGETKSSPFAYLFDDLEALLCHRQLLEAPLTQRFYFDLKNGHDFIRDDEGVEASDLDQATTEAQVVIDEMREGEELVAVENEWRLVIRDENGATLKTLPLDYGQQ